MVSDNRQPFRTPDPGRNLDRNDLIVPMAGEEDRRLREIDRNIALAKQSIIVNPSISPSVGVIGGTGSNYLDLTMGEMYPSFPITLGNVGAWKMWWDEQDEIGLGAGSLVVPCDSTIRVYNPADLSTHTEIGVGGYGAAFAVPFGGKFVYQGSVGWSAWSRGWQSGITGTGELKVWEPSNGTSTTIATTYPWQPWRVGNKVLFPTFSESTTPGMTNLATAWLDDTMTLYPGIPTEVPGGGSYSGYYRHFRAGYGEEYLMQVTTGWYGAASASLWHRHSDVASEWTQIDSNIVYAVLRDACVANDGCLWYWYSDTLCRVTPAGVKTVHTPELTDGTYFSPTGIAQIGLDAFVVTGYISDGGGSYYAGVWVTNQDEVQLVWLDSVSTISPGLGSKLEWGPPTVRSDGAVAFAYGQSDPGGTQQTKLVVLQIA